MHILKEGTKLKPKISYYKKECEHCGCVFEFTTQEAEKLYRSSMPKLGMVKCPQCHIEMEFTALNYYRTETAEEKDECQKKM